ncbi:MAG: hypothetical protein ABI740_02400 [Alphaproteobacteria bacterium]
MIFMIFWLFVAALSVIVLVPDTPTAKMLRHWLVDEPARLLREATPRKVARAILVVVALVIIAAAAPEFLALTLSFGDVGLAIELFGALTLLALNRNIAGALKRLARLARLMTSTVRMLVSAYRRRALRQRDRRTRTGKRPPSNDGSDDAGPPAWAHLAAA